MFRPGHGIVTLTTDYGVGAYAGALRGAVLGTNPHARVVDIAHDVPAHNVRAGALTLYAAAPYFPAGAVHCAVVDPGVGSARRALCLETDHGFFVGPDNGLLVPAARRCGLRRAFVLDQPSWWRSDVSATFHGRDVFGPVAARLAAGEVVEDAGDLLEESEFVDLDFGAPRERDGFLACDVILVDAFGNVVTNVPAEDARKRLSSGGSAVVHVAGRSLEVRVAETYADVPLREAVLLVGSLGFLELAMNQGSAAATFGVGEGDELHVRGA